jgi:uncharacterized protein
MLSKLRTSAEGSHNPQRSDRSRNGPAGPVDQRPVENREDALLYTAPTFQYDTEVTGPVSVELYVGSSAVDTDFTGKLVDVWPDGYAENAAEGILRAYYRHPTEKGEFSNPGEVYKLTVDLWSSSNVFPAGHRLRLEVTSSDFLHFDCNLNTREDRESGTQMVKATDGPSWSVNSLGRTPSVPKAYLIEPRGFYFEREQIP